MADHVNRFVSKAEKPPRFHRSRARVQQTLLDAQTVRKNPKAVGSIMRRGFVRLWRLRGGGFYGLGWVVCFFWLQFQALRGDVSDAQGVADFASNWIVEKLLTFGFETFLNMGLAFAWPGFFIQWLGGIGIALFVAGFFVVDRLAKPKILALFPELNRELDAAQEGAETPLSEAEAVAELDPEDAVGPVLSSPANIKGEDGNEDERR